MNHIIQGPHVDRSMASSIILLARPHFLIPGFLLYALGFMFAVYNDGVLSLDRFLLGYSIMMPAHLAVSFSNDYFDVEADAISKRNPISGGSGILVQRPELRPLALRIALGLMLLSAIMATIFFLVYHPAWHRHRVEGALDAGAARVTSACSATRLHPEPLELGQASVDDVLA